jgi:hypothetical protein
LRHLVRPPADVEDRPASKFARRRAAVRRQQRGGVLFKRSKIAQDRVTLAPRLLQRAFRCVKGG